MGPGLTLVKADASIQLVSALTKSQKKNLLWQQVAGLHSLDMIGQWRSCPAQAVITGPKVRICQWGLEDTPWCHGKMMPLSLEVLYQVATPPPSTDWPATTTTSPGRRW